MSEVSRGKKASIIFFYFCSGTFLPIWVNVLYNCKSIGNHNVLKNFNKPWFCTLSSSISMHLMLYPVLFSQKCKCPSYKMGDPLRGWGLFRKIAIPAMCDLMATVLQNISILFLPISIYQMIRGIVLVFTALLTIFYRHRKLNLVDWFGVILTTVSVVIVSIAANIMNKQSIGSTGKVILGIFILLLAEFFLSLTNILTEEFLHDTESTPMLLIAFDGTWQLFFLTFILLPLANIMPPSFGNGISEDTIDSFKMLGNSYILFVFILLYISVMVVFEISFFNIISFSNALNGSILTILRTAAIWGVSVMIYYIFPNSGAGEKLSYPGSLIELSGFIVCLFGTLFYNRVIKLPCLENQNVSDARLLSDANSMNDEE